MLAYYQGWASGQVSALPRPANLFQTGMFGPQQPFIPVGIDAPEDGEPRPEPRRWQYPVAWNLPIGQPGSEGLKVASFPVLRAMADLYSVARACIQVRKEEILGLDWSIVPTDDAAKAMRGNKGAMSDWEKRKNIALEFWRHPDPNYHSLHSWLAAVLEEVMVVDALSIHIQPPRLQGKGPFGSNIAALELLDGATIRPLVDIHGATPRPPGVAYQQYLYGVPRVDLMDIISDADLDALGGEKPVAQYRGDQLLYLPYVKRAWTPYGFPGIERAIIPAVTGLKRQQYWLQYYQEGTIPGMFVIAPENQSSSAQVNQLQLALNAYAGDPAMKHKIIVLGHGADAKPLKPEGLADQFDSTLYEQLLMAYDVQPMELGLMPGGRTSGLGGSGMAEQSQNIQTRKATTPLLKWLSREIFDYVIQNLWGQADMQWQFQGMKEDEDQALQTQLLTTQVTAGIRSIDEARLELGEQPFGLPLTSIPVQFTPTGPIPLTTDAEAFAPTVPAPTEEPPASDDQQQGGGGDDGGQPPPPKPGQPPSDSGQPPEQADTPNTTPLHDAIPDQQHKAQLAELGKLARYLRHSKDVRRFHTDVLPVEVITAVAADLPKYGYRGATERVRKSLVAEYQGGKREKALAPIITGVAAALGGLARKLKQKKVTLPVFLDDAMTTMRQGYSDAYSAGADGGFGDAYGAAGKRPDGSYQVTSQDKSLLANLVEKQHSFLMSLAADIAAGTALGALGSRLHLYGQTTRPVYQHGYSAGFEAGADDNNLGAVTITWHAVDDDGTCDKCSARDGQEFNEQTLPGYPGDGGFGGEICDGGPQCRCAIEYQAKPVPKEAIGQDEDQPLAASARADIAKAAPQGAGVALVAQDTRRVLLMQRDFDKHDDASGQWEFPGGQIKHNESPQQAGQREWLEETGFEELPGKLAGQWQSVDGLYVGYVYVVAKEPPLEETADAGEVGALAWWDLEQLINNPAVRPELLAELPQVLTAINGALA